MESEDVLKSLTVMDASASLCDDELPQISNGVKESENPGVDFLEDLDLYLEDINDRLIISRMVSDSVIRGMVNAVEQEAAEKIAQKKLEVVRLKEKLHPYHVGVEEKESLGCPLMHYEPESTKHGMYSSFSDALVEHDRMRESVRSLRNAAKEQLKKLKKDIDRVRTSTSIRKISSGSELVGLGLGGILQEKVSEKWMDVDKTFDSLRTTQESIYREVDDMVYLSKASLCQWQLEREFQGEIEDMVIMNCIRSLQEEFEEKLWEQNARFYGNEGVNWVEKMKEISVLRQELDVISKSLSVPELGQLASQGSVENGDELSNSKRTDHLHRKVLGNHVSPSSSLWDGNGKHEESVITMPENLDVAQLKHMSKDDLVNYFKTEMTKMKRNHDYRVQEITEEFFSLKREYLKERGSSLPLRKDKEFEILRKKIPEVVQKLDDILVENEKLPGLNNNAESIGSLKDRLDFLLSENRQLRGLLAERKKEVNRLSSQVSDAAEQHSLAEANLLKMIENLKCSVEDSHIEASISEDVYKYLLREMTGQMKCLTEESNMHCNIMQEIYEIIFRDAAQNAAPTSNCEYEDTSKCEYEDSDMESIIMQGLCGVIFKEAFKEAAEKFSDMNMKYIIENELRASLESKAMKNEIALKQVTAELMKEKEKLVQETAAALAKEKEQLELASQELNVLRDQTSRQQISILESSVETIVMKDKLLEAFEQIESYKVKIHELKQKLELTMKDLREADSEKRMLLAATQEKQKKLSLVEAKEREHCKQMEVLVHILSKAVADFGCRVAEDNKRSNLRMENLSTQLSSLIQKVNILKRTGLLYKQRLERRCSDLQKAEAEVDLLGDEVDTLLSLLEKIYIALDHYSPILQHYPGIIEILKLVRRELSGESLKKV